MYGLLFFSPPIIACFFCWNSAYSPSGPDTPDSFPANSLLTSFGRTLSRDTYGVRLS